MARVILKRKLVSVLLIALVLFFVTSFPASAQEEKKDLRPERGIAVYPEYSGVTVSKGESVKMDLTVENKGRTDETVDVKISNVPKGWKAALKGASFLVSGLFVSNKFRIGAFPINQE